MEIGKIIKVHEDIPEPIPAEHIIRLPQRNPKLPPDLIPVEPMPMPERIPARV